MSPAWIVPGFFIGLAAGIFAAFYSPEKKQLQTRALLFSLCLIVLSAVLLVLHVGMTFPLSVLGAFLCALLMTQGRIRKLDPDLLEMAKVFRIPAASRIRYIYLPGMKTSWVSVILVSLIGSCILGAVGVLVH